jgi:hypothetical protein
MLFICSIIVCLRVYNWLDMAYKDIDGLESWVGLYYENVRRESSIGGVPFSYYNSLRGYFKHSSLLTDMILEDFGIVDYRLWFWIITKIKSGRNPVDSGGLFFRYEMVDHLCKERSYYSTKKLLLKLGLLVETPFKDYYILNPQYIIKLYSTNKKDK